jgi:acetylornithine deacetylase
MHDAILPLVGRLVGFNTVSVRPNMALIGAVKDYLAGHGVKARIVPNEDGTKANLFATIGPDVPGGVALSGHTDVVPVEGQDWGSDPFTATPKGDKLYGRGTADMKGFIAVALALVPEFKKRKLKRPIHFCFSYDEEITCLGVMSLLHLLGRELPKPALAIIGEPTSMRVVNAHKGVSAQVTTIVGRDGHSSAPHKLANAISYMGRFMGFLDQLAQELREEGDRKAIPGLDFDPAWTTLNLGSIHGGQAMNIVARECRLAWEFRPLPGVDAEAIYNRAQRFLDETLRPALLAQAPEGSITMERVAVVPALRPEKNGRAEALALQLTGLNAAITAAFGSEGGHFQDAGISAVMCGPGDIAQAHKPDEFIVVDQLAQCERFLLKLADWATA